MFCSSQSASHRCFLPLELRTLARRAMSPMILVRKAVHYNQRSSATKPKYTGSKLRPRTNVFSIKYYKGSICGYTKG
jgi:hypothetical protein